MKRIFCLFAFTVALCTSVAYPVDVSMGIKAGLNLGTIYGEYINEEYVGLDKDFQPGFVTGLTVQIKPGDMFCFVPEIIYSMKGLSVDYSIIGMQQTRKSLYSYLEFPLNVGLIIPAGTGIFPRVYTGPVFGFLMSTKTIDELGGHTYEHDVSKGAAQFEFSMDFGGACDIDLGTGLLLIDIRYTLGLTTLDGNTADKKEQYRTGTFSMMAGWGFKLTH